jgi:hypothetical protein
MEEFQTVDFNAETTFDVVKVLSFFRAFYEEMDWKFSAWSDDVLRRCWTEIHSEHDDVRMIFCIQWLANLFYRSWRTLAKSWHSATRSW